MKNIIIIVAIVVVVGAGALFLMNSGGDDANKNAGQTSSSNGESEGASGFSKPSEEVVETTTLDIKDFAFQPKNIKVKVGDTVTWTNQDTARHDITPDNESDDFKSSELLAKGESYSFTFTKAGTYSYFCSPHPYMKASVEVVE